MITEDYVSFETAKLLKEKGFDEDISFWYNENGSEIFFQQKYDIMYNWRVRQGLKIYQCPTIQMSMKWLREKGFHIYSPMEIDYDEDERGDKWYHDAAYCPEIRRVSDGKIM